MPYRHLSNCRRFAWLHAIVNGFLAILYWNGLIISAALFPLCLPESLQASTYASEYALSSYQIIRPYSIKSSNLSLLIYQASPTESRNYSPQSHPYRINSGHKEYNLCPSFLWINNLWLRIFYIKSQIRCPLFASPPIEILEGEGLPDGSISRRQWPQGIKAPPSRDGGYEYEM
jgi:hypothetical protein